jgi:hypothetical protein
MKMTETDWSPGSRRSGTLPVLWLDVPGLSRREAMPARRRIGPVRVYADRSPFFIVLEICYRRHLRSSSFQPG